MRKGTPPIVVDLRQAILYINQRKPESPLLNDPDIRSFLSACPNIYDAFIEWDDNTKTYWVSGCEDKKITLEQVKNLIELGNPLAPQPNKEIKLLEKEIKIEKRGEFYLLQDNLPQAIQHISENKYFEISEKKTQSFISQYAEGKQLFFSNSFGTCYWMPNETPAHISVREAESLLKRGEEAKELAQYRSTCEQLEQAARYLLDSRFSSKDSKDMEEARSLLINGFDFNSEGRDRYLRDKFFSRVTIEILKTQNSHQFLVHVERNGKPSEVAMFVIYPHEVGKIIAYYKAIKATEDQLISSVERKEQKLHQAIQDIKEHYLEISSENTQAFIAQFSHEKQLQVGDDRGTFWWGPNNQNPAKISALAVINLIKQGEDAKELAQCRSICQELTDNLKSNSEELELQPELGEVKVSSTSPIGKTIHLGKIPPIDPETQQEQADSKADPKLEIRHNQTPVEIDLMTYQNENIQEEGTKTSDCKTSNNTSLDSEDITQINLSEELPITPRKDSTEISSLPQNDSKLLEQISNMDEVADYFSWNEREERKTSSSLAQDKEVNSELNESTENAELQTLSEHDTGFSSNMSSEIKTQPESNEVDSKERRDIQNESNLNSHDNKPEELQGKGNETEVENSDQEKALLNSSNNNQGEESNPDDAKEKKGHPATEEDRTEELLNAIPTFQDEQWVREFPEIKTLICSTSILKHDIRSIRKNAHSRFYKTSYNATFARHKGNDSITLEITPKEAEILITQAQNIRQLGAKFHQVYSELNAAIEFFLKSEGGLPSGISQNLMLLLLGNTLGSGHYSLQSLKFQKIANSDEPSFRAKFCQEGDDVEPEHKLSLAEAQELITAHKAAEKAKQQKLNRSRKTDSMSAHKKINTQRVDSKDDSRKDEKHIENNFNNNNLNNTSGSSNKGGKTEVENEKKALLTNNNRSENSIHDQEYKVEPIDTDPGLFQNVISFVQFHQLIICLTAASGGIGYEELAPALLEKSSALPSEFLIAASILAPMAGAIVIGMVLNWGANQIAPDRTLTPTLKTLLVVGMVSVPTVLRLAPYLIENSNLKVYGGPGLYALLIIIPTIMSAFIASIYNRCTSVTSAKVSMFTSSTIGNKENETTSCCSSSSWLDALFPLKNGG